MTDKLEELKRLAEAIASRYEWVTEAWAFDHFGSELEAKFVVAANPATILELFEQIAKLERENKELRAERDAKQWYPLQEDSKPLTKEVIRAGFDAYADEVGFLEGKDTWFAAIEWYQSAVKEQH